MLVTVEYNLLGLLTALTMGNRVPLRCIYPPHVADSVRYRKLMGGYAPHDRVYSSVRALGVCPL